MASVNRNRVPGGVVHALPADLRDALIANPAALAAWMDITPLARNDSGAPAAGLGASTASAREGERGPRQARCEHAPDPRPIVIMLTICP